MSPNDAKPSRDLIMMIMALGNAYLDKGLYSEAAKRYNQLLSLRVANRHLYTNFSKALIGMRKFDRFALEIYQKAIQYDADNEEIYQVLAETFLKEKREDQTAVVIYEMAIQQETPNFDKIAAFLSELYFRQNDLQKCHDLSDRILSIRGYTSRSLELYMKSSWQTREFDETITFLKKLIDTTPQNTHLLQHLAVTFLEKKFDGEVANKPARFSYIDRQLLRDYISAFDEFDNLLALSFYLDLKKFFSEKTYWGALVNEELSDEPVYAYQTEEGKIEPFPPKAANISQFDINNDLLPKLSPFENWSENSVVAKSLLTFEDFQKQGASIFSKSEGVANLRIPEQADILTTIYLVNYQEIKSQFGDEQAQQVRKKFMTLLAEFLEKYQLGYVWCAANGLLLFSNHLANAVSLVIDLLNTLNRYNFVNQQPEHIHIVASIHNAREGLGQSGEHVLKDIAIGVKLATATEKDLSEDSRSIYGKTFSKIDRLFISAKAYRQIKSTNRFKVNSIGQFQLRYLKDTINVYEIPWRNPGDELRFGYIKKISRFELLSEIGMKGSVKVYKAKDANLNRFVILKVIQSEVFNSLPANSPQKIDFYKFVKALGQLSHPNIVNIYEVDEDKELTYFAREYVEGIPFTEVFTRSVPFKKDRFIKIIYQIFKGLHHSHRLGFMHLNLKPNNIIVGANDETKLSDFLIPGSLFADEKHRDEQGLLYTSPERLTGTIGDQRSDLFSLGTIMYQAITLLHPFADSKYATIEEAVLNTPVQPPSEINKEIPRFFDALLLKCLEKNPDERFQSAEQVIALLKKNFEKILFSNFHFQIAQARDSL